MECGLNSVGDTLDSADCTVSAVACSEWRRHSSNARLVDGDWLPGSEAVAVEGMKMPP